MTLFSEVAKYDFSLAVTPTLLQVNTRTAGEILFWLIIQGLRTKAETNKKKTEKKMREQFIRWSIDVRRDG